MSNKVIVVWGSIIILLVCTLFLIGSKYQGEIKYMSLKEEVKTSVKKYMKDNNLKAPLVITSEELESLGYIKELKLEEKVCASDINVSKKFIFTTYDIKFTCIKSKN